MALRHGLPRLISALLRGRAVEGTLGELLRYLRVNARRARPKHDRSKGRLRAGLAPALAGDGA